METRGYAAVVILGLLGGIAARADEPPSPIRRLAQGNLAVDMKAGADGRNLVGIDALPGGRIGLSVKVPGQDALKMVVESAPGGRLLINDREDHSLECKHLSLNLGRDEPAREPKRDEQRFEELDEARASVELLELEVEADKAQIQQLISTLGQVGFQIPEQGIDEYQKRLASVRARFVERSKNLGRERRHVAELEKKLSVAGAVPTSKALDIELKDVDRILELILKGVDTWKRSADPKRSPSPAPEERPSKDVERLLDLLRKGVETWQQSPSPTPPSPPIPPEERSSTDAERILDLLLRGVENLQRP